MRTVMGMCLNRNVLIGLAAVGLGLFLFAPNLALAALPFLLLAACPLSMVLMPLLMGRKMQQVMQGPQADQPTPPEERLSELQTQLRQLQGQQAAITNQITELEQTIRSAPAQELPQAHELPPGAERKEQHEAEVAKAR